MTFTTKTNSKIIKKIFYFGKCANVINEAQPPVLRCQQMRVRGVETASNSPLHMSNLQVAFNCQAASVFVICLYNFS